MTRPDEGGTGATPGWSDDRGATATEYAILIALIAIAIVGGITLFGSQLNQWFSTLAAGVP